MEGRGGDGKRREGVHQSREGERVGDKGWEGEGGRGRGRGRGRGEGGGGSSAHLCMFGVLVALLAARNFTVLPLRVSILPPPASSH